MDKKVSEYIQKQKSPQKEIIERVRKIIFKTFPGMKEESKWGVIAYDGGRYYLAALRDKVNVGFAILGLSEEEVKLFEGGGKTARHIKVRSIDDIDEKKLVKLLKLVKKKATCPEC